MIKIYFNTSTRKVIIVNRPLSDLAEYQNRPVFFSFSIRPKRKIYDFENGHDDGRRDTYNNENENNPLLFPCRSRERFWLPTRSQNVLLDHKCGFIG